MSLSGDGSAFRVLRANVCNPMANINTDAILSCGEKIDINLLLTVDLSTFTA